MEGDHGLRGQHKEHRLPNNVFMVEYRLVNPMTINVTLVYRRCPSIQGNVLLRKFHMCSIGARLALFSSFCSPMYTSQLWWNYKKCTMKRLLINYHNVFKMSISMSKYESTSLLCTVYYVLCCQAVIRNLVYRFMCRLQTSNNSLVMSIQSSSLVYTTRIRKHWRRLLYVHG